MNVTDVIQLVTTLGFPIVMCGAMAWYVKYIQDKNNEQISDITAKHQEEIAQVTEALNNNTLVMQRLCDKLGS